MVKVNLSFHGVVQGFQQLAQKQGTGPARRKALSGPKLCEYAFDDVDQGRIGRVVDDGDRSTEHLA